MSEAGVVIAAAGAGTRVGGRVPKQFRRLGRVSILERSIALFEGHPGVSAIVLVVPAGAVERMRRRWVSRPGRNGPRKVVAVVAGGAERQESVWNGLRAFPAEPEVVLVHDAVRPFVTHGLISDVIAAARRYGAAVPGVMPGDTIAERGQGGFYGPTLKRSALLAVQTPQGFSYPLLCRAHAAARLAGFRGTDDASLVQRLKARVRIVAGTAENVKITTRADLRTAQSAASPPAPRRRAGTRRGR